MKTRLLAAFVLCNALLLAQSPHIPVDRYSRISIEDPDIETLKRIAAVGIDLQCGGHWTLQDNTPSLQIECSVAELKSLDQTGVAYAIQITDVQSFYAERARLNLNAARAQLRELRTASDARMSDHNKVHNYDVPEHFELGDLGGFLFYNQILDVLDTMAMLYPHLITPRRPLSDSLRTSEGREVYWVKISDHPASDEPEPEVLYTALTHAREPASTMSLLYFMWYLLENYETDAEVQRIVDLTELYFIPVLNPDGYIYNQTIAPEGGGMWRKNLHDNDGNHIIDDKDGVDLNRNFGYFWGYDNIGSSPHPSISTYRGSAPFSEPETQMVRQFVHAREFVTAMHDHTYGTDLYYPWEHGPGHMPDGDFFYRTSDLMAWNNRYLFGESHQTYWLGRINGGVNDWFYGEQEEKPKIYSWLAEIGPAFWPDPQDIVEICQQQMEPHLMVARIAGQHARIHNLNTSSCDRGVNTLTFRIENLGLQKGDFEVFLVPGTPGITAYTLQNEGRIAFQHSLESSLLWIEVTVDSLIEEGSSIPFELILKSGGYLIDHLSVVLVCGVNHVLQYESQKPLEIWQTEDWGEHRDKLESVWITDSPAGNQLNAFNTISLRDQIDLRESTWARASFRARWSVETTHDFVQFQARLAGGDWIALPGRYTKSGIQGNFIEIPSPHAGQPDGQPVYDGRQLTWIRDEIDLARFLGEDSVEFRFVAWSGGTVSPIEEDGFYFADFNIHSSHHTHCFDGVQNADEMNIDCGGTNCKACPSCDDGILNGEEAGTDCGGPVCTPCPSCSDGIQNQDETEIDCGGLACQPCITCDDGVQNGSETGIDCGGDCLPCQISCTDGVMNGDETGIDCGGSCPYPCILPCCPGKDDIRRHTIELWVTLTPNPVTDQLEIRIEEHGHVQNENMFQYNILDLGGRSFDRGILSSGTTMLEVSHLPAQMFVLRIFNSKGAISFQRFLKVDEILQP